MNLTSCKIVKCELFKTKSEDKSIHLDKGFNAEERCFSQFVKLSNASYSRQSPKTRVYILTRALTQKNDAFHNFKLFELLLCC